MEWWEALLMGILQGLTEFLPVSSSGHLMIARDLLGVNPEGFLDFTVTVHFATVLSTIIIFRKQIWDILKGVLKFKNNDQMDYFLKLCVSMVPVAVVGLFFKDKVESVFADSLLTVAICLLVTAALLCFSDFFSFKPREGKSARNGISYLQAIIVGLGQAIAVAPGLSRSGTTIATGLISGVTRENMAQFSFLMVLVPIIGEQLLSLPDMFSATAASGPGALALVCGFVGAFVSGLLACSIMVALVRKARLSWFALYCALVAAAIFIFAR